MLGARCRTGHPQEPGSTEGINTAGRRVRRCLARSYEWLYVLDGRLRLLLGDHDIVLTPGEAAEFDTHTPHAFLNPGPTPTELLILLGAQGQRAHVRARPASRSSHEPTG